MSRVLRSQTEADIKKVCGAEVLQLFFNSADLGDEVLKAAESSIPL